MVKAIFFDVDGTLVSHTQKAVSKSTRAALDKLAEKGIKRVLATGRHMLELQLLPGSDIPFDGYITLNGQLCLDARKNLLSGSPFTGAEKEAFIRLFKEKAFPIVLVEKDRFYINFINQQVETAQYDISTPIPEIGEYTGNDFYLAVVFLDQEQATKYSHLLTKCKATRWHGFAMDVISASGGKTEGIKNYLNIHNILPEETMAFGDGENDIDMLQFVHTGVAMGNAQERVKACADYVTASVDEDGIMKALTALQIIDSL